MNGTMHATIQPSILLLLTQFLHEPLQPNHLFTSSVAARYYASIIESETTFCGFEIQLIVVPPILKTYHMVLLMLSLSPSIFESTYPYKTMFEPPKHNA